MMDFYHEDFDHRFRRSLPVRGNRWADTEEAHVAMATATISCSGCTRVWSAPFSAFSLSPFYRRRVCLLAVEESEVSHEWG